MCRMCERPCVTESDYQDRRRRPGYGDREGRDPRRFLTAPKWMWAIFICGSTPLGGLAYLAFGKVRPPLRW
jgi:hypothetical protein